MRPFYKAIATVAASASLLAGSTWAAAAPMAPAVPIVADAGHSDAGFQQVRMFWPRVGHQGGFGRRRGFGGAGIGFGLGLLGGAIVGNEIANDGYYPDYYDPDYSGDYGYGTNYCERHFRSYDPVSHTYLGYDGHRHSCS